jgi:integrase
LASLTPGSFELDAEPPIVHSAAAYAKNRKEAVQPIPADLADALRGYLADKPAVAPVWPGTWSNEASAKMIRLDLADARKAWINAAAEPRERQERDQSDFLAYCNAAGEFADFHALRHTFITMLVQSGASPKTAQTLARHCDVRLTLGRYAHAGLFDLAAAVEALPSVLPDRQSDGLGDRWTAGKIGPKPWPVPGYFERQAETE